MSSASTAIHPRVSVILPTYNREVIIETSIKSIIDQRYRDWELIVIDDSSRDGTHTAVKALADYEKRIRVMRNERHKGLPHCRNIGASNAKGNLLFFTEDDLILSPDTLQVLVETYDELIKTETQIGAIGPRLLVKGPFKYSDKQKEIVKIDPMSGEIHVNFGLHLDSVAKVNILHSCSLIPLEVYNKVGGYRVDYYKGSYSREETDFYYRVKGEGYNLFYQPKAYCHHITGIKGGCILSSTIQQEYYNVLNHLLFLLMFYRWRTALMFPCFVGDTIKRIAWPVKSQ